MKTDAATRSNVPLWLTQALWAVAAVLVMIGVGAAIGRVVFADDVVTRAEPFRQWLMEALHREDPFAAQRPAELALVDGKFATNRLLTLWHVVPGGISASGGLLVIAVCRGFLAGRRRQVARHREWMIRVFALAVAISTVRVVAVPLDVALTPSGFRPPTVFALSVWTGWIITLSVAELWIRYTRKRRDFASVPSTV